MLFIAALCLAGCDLAKGALKREPVTGELQADALRIASKCQVPSRWLQARGQKALVLAADSGSTFGQIDCVMTGISNLPYKVELSFIGNEAYSKGSR